MPIENVPPGKKILRSIMSTKVKKKGPTLYQLVARMCADGSGQEKGIDYEFSYMPTSGAPPIRITLSLAASHDLILAIIDVVNCFQSTLIPEDERLIITMPPLYRKWFQKTYPKSNGNTHHQASMSFNYPTDYKATRVSVKNVTYFSSAYSRNSALCHASRSHRYSYTKKKMAQ